MKHDRPVSELLDECARALPEPFTRQDILLWFRTHHPDVPPSTVAARIFGLTAGDAPSRDRYQFGGSRPVLERVERGLYRRAPGRPRQQVLFGDSGPGRDRDVLPVGDVLLMGTVRTTVHHAARAADVCTGALFARRRQYAEGSGRPWFVLNGRWGIAAPDEVVVPADLAFAEVTPAYRHGWAAFVLGQLDAVAAGVGVAARAGAVARAGAADGGRSGLAGLVVEVHAADAYVDALRPALDEVGALLVDPVDTHSLSETLAWYDAHGPMAASTRSSTPAPS